jgi:hypothetical protein
MAKRPRGVLARALDGRLDRSIVSDLGVLAGVAMCARGLFLLSSALGWLFVGAAVIGLSAIAVLPPKTQARSAPKGDS